jgi:hypothetical protein
MGKRASKPVPNFNRFGLKDRLIAFVFLAALASIGAVALWPIYQDNYFFVTVFGGTLLGILVQFFADKLRLSLPSALLIIAVALVVSVVPLTNPNGLSNLGSFSAAWLESVQSIVLGWKQLVTIDIPVGTYQSLLGPVLVLSLLSGFISARVIWGRASNYWLPVVPLFVMVAVGIGFGGSGIPRSFTIGSTEIPIAPALVFGFIALSIAILYLGWAGAAYRRGTRAKTKDKAYRQGVIRRIRRTISAGLVVTLATSLVGASIVYAGVSTVRDVLRTNIDPLTLIKKQVSPLSTYRQSFTDPEALNSTVITVTSDGPLPERVRLAVMPFYDGTAFKVASETGQFDEASSFSRLPWSLSPRVPNRGTSVITMSYQGSTTPWLPTVNNLKSVSFLEDGAGTLGGSLYVNRQTGTAVLVPVPDGPVSYNVEWYVPTETTDLAAITPLERPTIDESLIPSSLSEWFQSQDLVVSSGAELALVLERLRARGYLSHSLEEPTALGQDSWLSELPGYTFQPSLSGHSIRRIDTMFAELNARQAVAGSTEDSQLVAAIGDDEQFATAAALLAAKLGFNSRVAVGFRLVAASGDGYAVPACDSSGVCSGRNLTAWIEVSGRDGEWVAMDITPQYANPIAPQSSDRQDPKNPTVVIGDNATLRPPPPSNPDTGFSEDVPTPFNFDIMGILAVIFAVLQWTLVTLFIASPFALVLWAKRQRRLGRRTSERSDDKLVGAWDEYVDLMVDFGRPIMRKSTRSELMAAYKDPNGPEMAALGDYGAFADYFPDDKLVERAWDIVEETGQTLRTGSKLPRRILGALSIRSFVRDLSPRGQIDLVRGALSFSSTSSTEERPTLSSMGRSVLVAVKKIRLGTQKVKKKSKRPKAGSRGKNSTRKKRT